MAAKSSMREGPSSARPHTLTIIRQKLERVLHSRNGAVVAYRQEVTSIIDAIDAVNREAISLRQRLHRGDSDVD